VLCSCVNLRAGGDTWLDAFLSPWHCSYLTVSIINASLCPTCWRCEIDLSPWPAVLLTQAPAIAPCPTLQIPALGRTYSNLPWPAGSQIPQYFIILAVKGQRLHSSAVYWKLLHGNESFQINWNGSQWLGLNAECDQQII